MNPLDQNIDELVGNLCCPFVKRLPKNLYTGETFFEHLIECKDDTELWIMTYTTSPTITRLIYPNRLLYTIGDARAKEIRQLSGIHTKLYLRVRKDKVVRSYLGSQNFVLPSTENLIVALPTSMNRSVGAYFNYFWTQAK